MSILSKAKGIPEGSGAKSHPRAADSTEQRNIWSPISIREALVACAEPVMLSQNLQKRVSFGR